MKSLPSLSRLVVFLVPSLLAIATSTVGSSWRDDAAAVSASVLSVRLGQGAITTLVAAASSALPLGDTALRGAFASALGLGLFALLAARIIGVVLGPGSPVRNEIIAALAALSCALSPLAVREGNVLGGGVVSGVLVAGLLLVAMAPDDDPRRDRRGLVGGALLGLLGMERASTALVVAVVLVLHAALRRRLQSERFIVLLLGAAFPFLLLVPLLLARPGLGGAVVELSLREDLTAMLSIDAAALRARGVSSFLRDIGPLAVGLTLVGFCAGMWRGFVGGFRGLVVCVPLLLLVLSDLLVPQARAAVLSPDPFLGIRLASALGAAVLAALGVAAVVDVLEATRIRFARGAAALVVAAFAATAAMVAEESFSESRANLGGASRFTEEAFTSLPPRAIVLVRTESVLRRMIAEQTLSGTRLDITVVPLPRLTEPEVAVALLAEEPGILPLLRDMGAEGSPQEAGLVALADTRPLFVEMTPGLSPRLASHLLPERLALRFFPQPLGSSDRRGADQSIERRAARVLGEEGKDRDPATRAVLAGFGKQLMLAASVVKDKEAQNRAYVWLGDLGEELQPSDPAYAFLLPQATASGKKKSSRRR